MDQNARPHRTRVVNKYIECQRKSKYGLAFPPSFFSPIENVWYILQRRVSARPAHPGGPRPLRGGQEFLALQSGT